MTRRRAVLVALAGLAFAGLSAGESADDPPTKSISGTANTEVTAGTDAPTAEGSAGPSVAENATAGGATTAGETSDVDTDDH